MTYSVTPEHFLTAVDLVKWDEQNPHGPALVFAKVLGVSVMDSTENLTPTTPTTPVLSLTLDDLLSTARELVDPDSPYGEYTRGIVEFIIELSPDLSQDGHKDAITALLDTRPV